MATYLENRPVSGVEPEGGFWNSVARGTDQAQAMMYAFANAIGEATGVDIIAEWGEEGVKRNIEEMMSNPPEVQSWDDIDGIGALATYVMERVGEQVPQMAAQAAAYAAATVVGKGAGVKVVNKALSNNAALGKALKRKLGNEAFEGFKTKAGDRVMGLMASGAVGYTQAAGETQMGFMEEGVDAPVSALGIGVAKSMLDLYGFDRIMRASKATGQKPASVIKAATQIAKQAGKASLAEGLTEATQAAIDQMALTGFTGESHFDAGELLESAIAGAAVAGTMTTGLASTDMAIQYGRERDLAWKKAEKAIEEHTGTLLSAAGVFPQVRRRRDEEGEEPEDGGPTGPFVGPPRGPSDPNIGPPRGPSDPEIGPQLPDEPVRDLDEPSIDLESELSDEQLSSDLDALDQAREEAAAQPVMKPVNDDPTHGAELASEPFSDLDAQLDAVVDPTSTKTSVFVPFSNEAQISDERVEQLRSEGHNLNSIIGTVGGQPGTIYTNKPEVLREIALNGDISNEDAGRLLYERPEGKADSDGTTILARDSDGNVVADVATSQATLERDLEIAEGQKPADGTVEVTDAGSSLLERQHKAAAEKQARADLAKRAQQTAPVRELAGGLAEKYANFVHTKYARDLEARIAQQERVDAAQAVDREAIQGGITKATDMLENGYNGQRLNAQQRKQVTSQVSDWQTQLDAMKRPMRELRRALSRQRKIDRDKGPESARENTDVLADMLLRKNLPDTDMANLMAVMSQPDMDEAGFSMVSFLLQEAHAVKSEPDTPDGSQHFTQDNALYTPIKAEAYDPDYGRSNRARLEAEREAAEEALARDEEDNPVYGDDVGQNYGVGYNVGTSPSRVEYTVPPALNRPNTQDPDLSNWEKEHGRGYDLNDPAAVQQWNRKAEEAQASLLDANTKIEQIRVQMPDGNVRGYVRMAHLPPEIAPTSYVSEDSDARVPTSKWTGVQATKYKTDKGKSSYGGVASPYGRSTDALVTDKIVQAAAHGKDYAFHNNRMQADRWNEVKAAIPEQGRFATERIKKEGVHELAVEYLGKERADAYVEAISRSANATFRAFDTNAPLTKIDLRKEVKKPVSGAVDSEGNPVPRGVRSLSSEDQAAYNRGEFIRYRKQKPKEFSSKDITVLGMGTVFNTGRAGSLTPGEAHLEGFTTGLLHLMERGYDLHIEGGPFTPNGQLRSGLLLKHGLIRNMDDANKDMSVGDAYGMVGTDSKSPEVHKQFREDYDKYLRGERDTPPEPLRTSRGLILSRSADWNKLSLLERHLQSAKDEYALERMAMAASGGSTKESWARLESRKEMVEDFQQAVDEHTAYMRKKHPKDPNWKIIDGGHGVQKHTLDDPVVTSTGLAYPDTRSTENFSTRGMRNSITPTKDGYEVRYVDNNAKTLDEAPFVAPFVSVDPVTRRDQNKEGYITEADLTDPDYYHLSDAIESRRQEKNDGVYVDPTGNPLPSASDRAQPDYISGSTRNVSMKASAYEALGPTIAHLASSVARDLGVVQPMRIEMLGDLSMGAKKTAEVEAIFDDPEVFARLYTYDGENGKEHTIVVRPPNDHEYAAYYTASQTGAAVTHMAVNEQFRSMPKGIQKKVEEQYQKDIKLHPYRNWLDADYGRGNWMNDKLVESMRKPLTDPTSISDRVFRNAAVQARKGLSHIPPAPTRKKADAKNRMPKSIENMVDRLARDYTNLEQPVQLAPYNPPAYSKQETARESRTDNRGQGGETQSHRRMLVRGVRKVFADPRVYTSALQSVQLKFVTNVDQIPGGKAHPDTDAMYVPGAEQKDDVVYLVTSNIKDVPQAFKALRHEIFGHQKLHRGMSSEDRAELLKRVQDSDKVPGLRGIWDKVREQYPDLSRMDQAEEAVARLAEKMVHINQNDLVGQAKYAFRKLRDFIIKMLRRSGLVPSGALTETEVRDLMGEMGARDPINAVGRTAAAAKTVFNEHVAPMPTDIRAAVSNIIETYKQDDMLEDSVPGPNAAVKTIDAIVEAINQRARVSPMSFLASRQQVAYALHKTVGQMLYHRSQTDMGHVSFATGVSRETAAWGGQVGEIFKKYSDAEIQVATEQLTQEVEYTKKTAAAKELTDLLDRFGDYLGEHVSGFEKIKNYFPRMYDTLRLEQERERVVEIMQKHGVDDPHDVVDKLVRIDDDFTEASVVTDQPGFAMDRKIKNPKLIAELAKEGYIRQDVQSGTRQYMERAIKRAEMERVFGGEMPSNIGKLSAAQVKKWNSLNLREKRAEKEKIDTWEEMTEQERRDKPELEPEFGGLVYSPVGTLHMLAGELSQRDKKRLLDVTLGSMLTVPIDRTSTMYKVMKETMAYESLRTLLGSGLASIPEIAGVFSRAKGDIGMLEFAKAMADIAASRGDADAWKELVEYMGVVRADTGAALATELTSQSNTGPISKFLPHLFKYNGNDAIVKFSRTLALGIGTKFIDNQTQILENAAYHTGGNLKNMFDSDGQLKGEIPGYSTADRKRVQDANDWLGEMGLDAETVVRWKKEGSPRWSPMQKTDVNDRAKKIQDGLNTFVNESIINPNAAELPGFTSTIPGRMIFHLKAFMYSFMQNIIGGMVREGIRLGQRGLEIENPKEKALYGLAAAGSIFPVIAVFLMMGGLTDEIRKRLFSLGERGTLDNTDSMAEVLSNWGSRAGFGSMPFYDVMDQPITAESVAYQLGPTAHHVQQTVDMLTKEDPQVMRAVLHSIPGVSQLPTVRRRLYNMGEDEQLTQEEIDQLIIEYEEMLDKADAA